MYCHQCKIACRNSLLSSQPVIELILNIQQNEFGVPITLKDQPDLFHIQDFYYRTGGCFWGAFIDGELVGTIALIKFDEEAGAIRKMFVKKPIEVNILALHSNY